MLGFLIWYNPIIYQGDTMSRAINLPTRASRTSEVGLFWREVVSGVAASIEIPKHSAIRIRAAANTTVSFDGVLSATMLSGEILVFNSGGGSSDDVKDTVTLTSSGSVFAQLGEELLTYRP